MARSSLVRRLDDAAVAGRPRWRRSICELALAEPERLLAAHPPCRRDLPRPPYARGDRRLRRRPQPRPADRRGARFSSGLGVFDFLKRTSIVGLTQRRCGKSARPRVTLAEAEGLDAHALSVALRLDSAGAEGGEAERGRSAHERRPPQDRQDHARRAHGGPPATPTSSTSARSPSSTCSKRTASLPPTSRPAPITCTWASKKTVWSSTCARGAARRCGRSSCRCRRSAGS